MKLKQITVKNFRGLKGDNNVVDFSNSNIIFLVGQNDVGKSTFLRAYEFFIDPKSKASGDDFYNYDANNPIEIAGEFEKEDEDATDSDLSKDGKTEEPDWINKWVDNNGIVRVKKVWKEKDGSFEKYTFSPSKNEWVKNGFGGLHQKFTKYAPTPIAINAMETEASLEEKVNKLINEEFIKKLQTEYAEDYGLAIQSIKTLQDKIIGSDTIKNYNIDINESFKKVFSNLTLEIKEKGGDNIKVEEAFKKNHSIKVKKDGIEREECFIQHGHGVIRQALFNFLAFLKKNKASKKKEYLILFEEPEIFLHPKITQCLRKNLHEISENSPYQIICATHSPSMIDISKPHSSLVRIVKDSKTEETRTYQAGDSVFQKDEETKKFVQMINKFNPHICELFYADTVLLVEGDSEAIIYRKLLEKYYCNEEIFVLNAGSKDFIPFFQEILTHFRIRHFIIHDTDIKSKDTAWKSNSKIWDGVVNSNSKEDKLARRYVHITDFETANNYNPKGEKLLSAYEFSENISENDSCPCMEIIKDITGKREILHDDNFINSISEDIINPIKNETTI